ncbi:MAG: glycosyltransferase [Gemmatimonadaceae bacterium]|nr:glycosyltransferase [Gemmatimonadaceae bacterium]
MSDRRLARAPVGVMHLTDTLDIGGAEHMAVNLVNRLPRDRFRPYLCTTRRSGPLADLVASDVGQISLDRRYRFDERAVRNLVHFIRAHDVSILHAHGTAVFTAAVAALLPPYPLVIWHIHFGRHASVRNPGWMYRLIARRVDHTITVNEALASWASARLGIPAARVSYIPNFASCANGKEAGIELPGTPGERIVCVANFLPEKDHATLLRAMQQVVRERPAAHLLLVGAGGHTGNERGVRKIIDALGISDNVTMLGQRRDVPTILAQADIGVLSSTAEGLPLALIEYGRSGLPTVVTRVGQCADVVDGGRAGMLVTPGRDDELAAALLELLGSADRRAVLAAGLRERTTRMFDPGTVMGQISAVYDEVMA